MTDLQAIITQLEGAKNYAARFSQANLDKKIGFDSGIMIAISIVREHIKGGFATPEATKQSERAKSVSDKQERTHE